jgi:hypothetical protein
MTVSTLLPIAVQTSVRFILRTPRLGQFGVKIKKPDWTANTPEYPGAETRRNRGLTMPCADARVCYLLLLYSDYHNKT